MKQQKLVSSFLASASYDQGILELTFSNGKGFRYQAEEKIYDDLIAAESAGSFYSKNIKGKLSLENSSTNVDDWGASIKSKKDNSDGLDFMSVENLPF